jgi:hypothetical protein
MENGILKDIYRRYVMGCKKGNKNGGKKKKLFF